MIQRTTSPSSNSQTSVCLTAKGSVIPSFPSFKLSITSNIDQKSRCFVHIANSLVWRAITGEARPTVPFTAKEYTRHCLPWFEYFSDNSAAVKGSEKLKGLKSVVEMGKEKGDNPLPENESVVPERIVELRKGLKRGQVREGAF